MKFNIFYFNLSNSMQQFGDTHIDDYINIRDKRCTSYLLEKGSKPQCSYNFSGQGVHK